MTIFGIERYFISRKKKLEKRGFAVTYCVYRLGNGRRKSYGIMSILDFKSRTELNLHLQADPDIRGVKIDQSSTVKDAITFWGSFTPKQVDDQIVKFFTKEV